MFGEQASTRTLGFRDFLKSQGRRQAEEFCAYLVLARVDRVLGRQSNRQSVQLFAQRELRVAIPI
jgi:hypothetical protein